jgi:hypothetical protein
VSVLSQQNNSMYSPLLPPSPAGQGYPDVMGLRFPFYPPGRLAADYPGILRPGPAGIRAGGIGDSWAAIATAKDPNIEVPGKIVLTAENLRVFLSHLRRKILSLVLSKCKNM